MDDEDGEPDDGGMDALMDGEGDGDFVQDDLDADIPDGEGRYEHTDTEVEDESSFEGEGVLGRSSVWGVGGGGVEMGGERPRRSTGREG